MENNIGIYSITNILNNKIYVGCSKNIKNRLYNHKRDLIKGIHVNRHLQQSFNKYGKNYFKFEVLENCSVEFIYSQENYWCNILDSHNRCFGYNIKGTNPYSLCVKLSEETKKRMSESKKGIRRSEAHCLNISKGKKGMVGPNTGKSHSEETKAKMRKAHIGKTMSEEARRKISEFNKGKHFGPTTSISKYSIDNILIDSYDSVTIASKLNNISRTAISNNLTGLSKKAGGYIWKYKN